jgi:pteridine reductase
VQRVDLTDRWALVTGGARRVGRAIVAHLAAAGANVVVHHHTSTVDADVAVRDARALGREAIALRADLADPRAAEGLVREAEAETGGVTVLVNNAANYLRTPWETLDETVWDRSMALNLKAPYLLSVRFGDAMRRRREGVIVNVTDWAADRPYRDYLPYSVSKAGLVGLTRALARELAPDVRVNAVAPGPVVLPEGTSSAQADAIRRATPLGLGSAQAVARAVRFLVEDATFTTGSVLYVDGGRTMV